MLMRIHHSLFRAEGNKKFIPGIAWFLLTLIAISIPGYDLPQMGDWFDRISTDKLIHTVLFGTLSFLFMYPLVISSKPKKEKWNGCIRIALATILWGFTTELIQKYFIPGRSYDIVDFMFDSIGAIIAFVYFKIRYFKSAI
jgi:hypothetical protein